MKRRQAFASPSSATSPPDATSSMNRNSSNHALIVHARPIRPHRHQSNPAISPRLSGTHLHHGAIANNTGSPSPVVKCQIHRRNAACRRRNPMPCRGENKSFRRHLSRAATAGSPSYPTSHRPQRLLDDIANPPRLFPSVSRCGPRPAARDTRHTIASRR